MAVDEKRSDPSVGGGFTKHLGDALERFAETSSNLFPQLTGRRISLSKLKQLLLRMGNSTRAGIDIRRVIEQESRTGPIQYRPVFAEILRRISHGDSLADAVRGAGDFFPPMVREMVHVGEHTGKLDSVLLRLADHYDHIISLRRMFLLGIAWPAIQLIVAIMLVGLLIWAVGAIADMQGGQPIDYLGLGLTGTRGLLIYIALVLGTVSLIGGAIMAIRQGWLGDTGWRLALRIPLLGKCLETMALARLTWTLSLTQESGADARHSIRMALRSAQLPLYTDRIEQADSQILHGKEFHQALGSLGVFPDEFLHAVEVAETSGQLSESMIHLSNEYAERAANSTKMLTAIATFTVYGGVALLLIFLILRIFMSYVKMLESFL